MQQHQVQAFWGLGIKQLQRVYILKFPWETQTPRNGELHMINCFFFRQIHKINVVKLYVFDGFLNPIKQTTNVMKFLTMQ